jgi:hypothetical protein
MASRDMAGTSAVMATSTGTKGGSQSEGKSSSARAVWILTFLPAQLGEPGGSVGSTGGLGVEHQ